MSNQDKELKLLLSICMSWEIICQTKQGWKSYISGSNTLTLSSPKHNFFCFMKH